MLKMLSNYLPIFVLLLAGFNLTFGFSSDSKLDELHPKLKIKLLEAPRNETVETDINSPYTPVVFWHGMGDTAFGSINIDRMALKRMYPNMTVLSVQIGNNSFEDELSSYFINVNYQVEEVCKELLKNEYIRSHKAFNAVGFSQGGQFLRALIQRCPFRENGIKVKNFISLGGQHQGVFGLPRCLSTVFCEYIRHLLTTAVYDKNVQDHLVQAEYWHDPLREEEYKSKNVFLADINNENQINEGYKESLLSLENMVLVQFLKDEMIVPRESSLFGFFASGQTKEIVPLEQSSLYLEDRLGLRQLDKTGRLHQMKIPGTHLRYEIKWFLDEIASVYLNN